LIVANSLGPDVLQRLGQQTLQKLDALLRQLKLDVAQAMQALVGWDQVRAEAMQALVGWDQVRADH
jgi:hypothetical protein